MERKKLYSFALVKTVFQYSILALIFWIGGSTIGWGAEPLKHSGQSEEKNALNEEIKVPEFFLSTWSESSEGIELFDFEEEEEDSKDNEEDVSKQSTPGNYNCFSVARKDELPCHCKRLNQPPTKWNAQHIPWFQVIGVFRI